MNGGDLAGGRGQTRPDPELDLAFRVAGSVAPALLDQAGPWADPKHGEALWRGRLSGWLADLTAELPAALRRGAYSAGLELCDDATIAELNGQWRRINAPTDVLAFAAQEEGGEPGTPQPPAGGPDDPESEPLELGDIVISIETAARQAMAADVSLARELAWLASHGLLHLLGWDHPDESSLEAMLQRQDQLLEDGSGGRRDGHPGQQR